MTQVSGDMTSGEMTLGRLDRLPMIRTKVKLKILANFTVGGLHNGSGKASILLRNLKTS